MPHESPRPPLARTLPFFAALTFLALLAAPASAQKPTYQTGVDGGAYVPALQALMAEKTSELRDVVARFSADRWTLQRRWDIPYSATARQRMREFYQGWTSQLRTVDFDKLSQSARIDYVLLRTLLRHQGTLLDREEKLWRESSPLLPFGEGVIALQEKRRRMEPVNATSAAKEVAAIASAIDRISRRVSGDSADVKPSKIVAYRSAEIAGALRRTLGEWYTYYAGYDPQFTWWVRAPYLRADSGLTNYVKLLREKIVGVKPGEDEPIVGDPIGRDAIIADLRDELIAYTPEDLVAVAEREFAWCEAEMKKASRAMGFGDDWKKAIEKVKEMHVPPGEQTDVVRQLAFEAIDFVTQHDLMTVPPLARDDWRMEMMSPERQKVNPFFLGGDDIIVSFPTDGMSQEEKEMSMRGNNTAFSHATVFHELIPGHHMQYFMNPRYNAHRQAFDTPFWGEGWALYWEMTLWDEGFQATPENRVGALFWRMHRCARIIFSLGFHLGNMTPAQAIDFLVDRVGHERANATAEVRRSFNGSYPPLYQLAYMMGGLQFRALHAELVKSGKMTNRAFHDAIVKGGSMPVEMVRAMLINATLSRDYEASWKYAGALR